MMIWLKLLLNQAMSKFFIFILTLAPLGLYGKYQIEVRYTNNIKSSFHEYFLKDLELINSKKKIHQFLLSLDWIDSFSMSSIPFSKKIDIKIYSKKPVFLLNNKKFIDLKGHAFNSNDNTYQHKIIKVSGPTDDYELMIMFYKFFEKYKKYNDLDIQEIIYSHVNGWIIKSNSSQITIGNNSYKKRLATLKSLITHIDKNNKNFPTMIDLRYEDGVTINYVK